MVRFKHCQPCLRGKHSFTQLTGDWLNPSAVSLSDFDEVRFRSVGVWNVARKSYAVSVVVLGNWISIVGRAFGKCSYDQIQSRSSFYPASGSGVSFCQPIDNRVRTMGPVLFRNKNEVVQILSISPSMIGLFHSYFLSWNCKVDESRIRATLCTYEPLGTLRPIYRTGVKLPSRCPIL